MAQKKFKVSNGIDVAEGILIVDGSAVTIDGALDINSSVDIDITGGNFDVLTDGTVSLAGNVVDINSTNTLDITSANAITLESTAASVNLTGNSLLLTTTTGFTVTGGSTFNNDVDIAGDLNLTTIGKGIYLPDGRYIQEELDARAVQNGFIDKSDSIFSVDEGTLEFTIEPTGAEFEFYAGGKQFLISAPDTISFTDVTGIHYFYYVGRVLTHSTSFSSAIITEYAYVAAIYWNSTTQEAILIGDERHGKVMSNETHSYLHETQGAKLVAGGALGNIVADGDGTNAAHAQIAVANTTMRDEDLRFAYVDGDPQTIAGIAQLPILWHDTDGSWRKDSATGFVVKTTGTGRAAYNQDTGDGTWAITEVSDGAFVNMHVAVTSDVINPFVLILGQNEYATLNDAVQGGGDEAGRLEFGGLSGLRDEWVFLGTLIIQTDNTFTNAVKSIIRADVEGHDYLDLRGTTLTPSGGTSADDHAGLTNLQGGGAGTYYHSNQPINTTDIPTFAGLEITWQNTVDLYTLVAGQKFLVPNTVSTLYLPGAPAGNETITLMDVDSSWGTSPVTLDSNGTLIEGSIQNLILNVPGSTLELVYTTSVGWKII